jgi:hypothetical protein
LHESAFKLMTKDTKVLVHKRLELQSTLQVVQLLHGLETPGVILITACAEQVLDKMTILKSIIHCG